MPIDPGAGGRAKRLTNSDDPHYRLDWVRREGESYDVKHAEVLLQNFFAN
jgi:hypothetical protein